MGEIGLTVAVYITIIGLLLLVSVSCLLGKRLHIYSVASILQGLGLNTASQEKHSTVGAKLKASVIVFMVRVLIGFVWSLAKLRIPIESLVMNSFRGKLGYLARASYWKANLGHLGMNVRIETGVHFINPSSIFINDYSWIDKNVVLHAGNGEFRGSNIIYRLNPNYHHGPGELRIGRFCHIAPNAIIQALAGVALEDCASVASGGKIYSVSNHIRNPKDLTDKKVYKWSPMVPLEEQLFIVGPVVLKKNSGLGLNAVVLPGVTINENSLVAVNSIALHDIAPNTIAKSSLH